jgi:hypothetical protein
VVKPGLLESLPFTLIIFPLATNIKTLIFFGFFLPLPRFEEWKDHHSTCGARSPVKAMGGGAGFWRSGRDILRENRNILWDILTDILGSFELFFGYIFKFRV